VYERVHKQRRAFFDSLTADMDKEELVLLDSLLLRVARRADRLALGGMSVIEETA
jgi:hypothetical protein